MDQNQELNLNKIIVILKKHLCLIIVVTVLAGISGFLVSKLLITPKFQSTATLIINVNDNTSALVTYDDVTLSQKLVDTYVVILKNHTLLNNVIKRLHLNMDAGSLAGNITIKAEGTTEILEIIVQDTSPQRAKSIADAIVELAPNEIARTVKAGSVEIISPAQLNGNPVSPETKKNTFIGLLTGFLISCLIAFIIEMRNNKFKTDEDITEKLGYTTIGIIPNLYKIKGKQKICKESGLPEIITSKMPFQIVEAYNALRTNLEFINHEKNIKKIIVTSSVADEGKTTVAINLAISLGQLGYKTLIMDMDLRKPNVRQFLKLDRLNNGGVTMILDSKSSVADSIYAMEDTPVYAMPSGPIPPNPNELIQSNAMKNLLKELEKNFDYIIFDTPPISAVADAMTLLPMADGVLFVVKQDHTTFETAINAKKSLEQVNAHILGCILNAYDVTKTDCYYSSHRDKKGYLYTQE